jgi:hypothetical protein
MSVPVTASINGGSPLSATFRIDREPDDFNPFDGLISEGRKTAVLTVPNLPLPQGQHVTYRITLPDGTERTGYGWARQDSTEPHLVTTITGGLDEPAERTKA